MCLCARCRQSLGERVEGGEKSGAIRRQDAAFGNMQMTFSLKKVTARLTDTWLNALTFGSLTRGSTL